MHGVPEAGGDDARIPAYASPMSLGSLLRELRIAAGLSQSRLAERLNRLSSGGAGPVTREEVSRWEHDKRSPRFWLPFLAAALNVPADLLRTAARGDARHPADSVESALELELRVQATDVSVETLTQLAAAHDGFAMRYATSAPADLLRGVHAHLGYVRQLIGAKMTLRQHRQLLQAGGWLSLLGATLHIDLKQSKAATAYLRAAQNMAIEAEDLEIHGYCLETAAWRAVIDGQFFAATRLSRQAQAIAPRGGSALIQATAQEGRAWARLGRRKETYAAIDRVAAMAEGVETPEHPEHHYHYDPVKFASYRATTLAWAGDPAAEGHARELIARLTDDDARRWPRRLASAKIDLALALLAAKEYDEACSCTLDALTSGRVVPSNRWRVLEIVKAVEKKRPREAAELREFLALLRRRDG